MLHGTYLVVQEPAEAVEQEGEVLEPSPAYQQSRQINQRTKRRVREKRGRGDGGRKTATTTTTAVAAAATA